MKGIDGLYTAYNALIASLEEDNRLAINVDTLMDDVKKEVDVHSASLEWYIRFALRAAAEVSLYNAGYRSVVKGTGIFVNPHNCNKPEYLARMFNNAVLSEEQKKKVVEMLKGAIKESGCEGQMFIDFDTGKISEGITTEQLISLLEEDAKAI